MRRGRKQVLGILLRWAALETTLCVCVWGGGGDDQHVHVPHTQHTCICTPYVRMRKGLGIFLKNHE